jgi:hypothetical protein
MVERRENGVMGLFGWLAVGGGGGEMLAMVSWWWWVLDSREIGGREVREKGVWRRRKK